MSDDTRLIRVTIHDTPIPLLTNSEIEAVIQNAIADEIEIQTDKKVEVTVRSEHTNR